MATAADQTAPSDLAPLKAQQIPAGQITLVERQDAPTLEVPNATPLSHLPPRTVVKIVLSPATGSRINVEVWLPDKDRWNGRFVGLGNGGAAGHINPATLPLIMRRDSIQH